MRRAAGSVPSLAAMVAWIALGPDAAVAQQAPLEIATAVAPDTVTVGTPFTSMVRVMAPPGSRVEFRGVPLADSVQQVDTVRVVAAAADSGATAAYRLVAWAAGPVRAAAEVRVTLADSSDALYAVSLATPVVRSVLPPGETPPPRPGRGVAPLPAGMPVWLWVAAALLLAAAAVLLFRRWARPTADLPVRDPRARALAEIDRLALDGDSRPTYEIAARILRRYLAAMGPGWGEEWTSSELVSRVRAAPEMDGAASDALARVLARADRVKFAGYDPPAPVAAEFVSDVRAWIERHPARPGVAAPREAA